MMSHWLFKAMISGALVALVSEAAKRSPWLASLIASLPLISLLTMVWMYLDGRDVKPIIEFSRSMVWLILPSFVLFLMLPWLLEKQVAFWLALLIASSATAAAYSAMIYFAR